jgi:flagellar basal-body rod protein FlgF
MDAALYSTLTRQSGLMREMQVVANNIANISTSGFRREGVMFSEYIAKMGDGPSLSMAHANTRVVDLSQAGITQTGGTFDVAIQGDGFFQLITPNGPRLSRAGAFSPSAEGNLVNFDGHILADQGGAPIAVPQGARAVAIAQDGTISADGAEIGRIGLWQPTDPLTLRHEAGVLFSADALEPFEGGTMLQGFLEDSNVNPVSEIARMIEVQRAYEMGQSFMDQEDRRMRGVIDSLGR